jgi:hypothetical protein
MLRHDRARSFRGRAILLALLGGALLACGHPSVGVVGDDTCPGANCATGGGAGTSSPGSTAAGGRTPSPDAAAGGSSSQGGGGAGNGAGGTAGAGGNAMPPGSTSDIIDNLEDNDGRIRVASGRQGPWHVFNSATNNGGNQKPAFTDTFTPEMGGANGTMYAVHTTGDGYTYAGVGFDLNNSTNVEESPQSQSYDASAWGGVAFSAKAGSSGSASLRIELSMKQFVPTDRGGSCTGDSCWNVYGSRAIQGQLTPNWQQFKIPFSTLERELGGTTPPFDPAQLMEISFKHEGNNDHFDFWVDEIQFYKDPPPNGGGNGAGGANGGGNNGGGSADGGVCMIGSAANGNGSYTTYWFGQGTGMDGDGYRTACGYFGHEPSSGDGTTDTVENIANPQYFAAIPSNSPMDFNSAKYCGACVEASLNGKSVVATIVDACPTAGGQNGPCASNPNGHLDLSLPAANFLGFGTGYPQDTTWKFVPCPVTGNVVVRIKPGNPDQVYIENELLPIATVRMNNANATRLFYGAWQLPGQASGQTLTLTDISGRTITVQVNGTDGQNQMSSAQFPVCSP